MSINVEFLLVTFFPASAGFFLAVRRRAMACLQVLQKKVANFGSQPPRLVFSRKSLFLSSSLTKDHKFSSPGGWKKRLFNQCPKVL